MFPNSASTGPTVRKRPKGIAWYAAAVLALVLVPFVFITDFYPLQRFGMFAEPVRSTRQTTRFKLLMADAQGTEAAFDPMLVGLTPAPFQVILRRKVYEGQGESLLAQVAALPANRAFFDFYIIGYHGTQADTLASYSR